MNAFLNLPLPLRLAAAAAGGGLAVGILLGTLTGSPAPGSNSFRLGESWALTAPPVDDLMAVLMASEQWRRGEGPAEDELPEPEPEPEPETEGRPGVFKHLQLVAILREPRLAAMLKPVKMPDDQRALMISSANDAGLIEVELETVVAEGWVVSGISDTYLQITGAESGEIVEYRLFQWE